VIAADAFLVALTRCSGIILGVVVSILLAILVFPKSASHQVHTPQLWQAARV